LPPAPPPPPLPPAWHWPDWQVPPGQEVPFTATRSAGHSSETPSQASAKSQEAVAGRQTVLRGERMLFGHTAVLPAHFTARSPAPAAARRTVSRGAFWQLMQQGLALPQPSPAWTIPSPQRPVGGRQIRFMQWPPAVPQAPPFGRKVSAGHVAAKP